MIIYDDDGIGYKVVPMQVIEDIKAEIKDEARRGMNERYCDGLRRALKLIDKHMKGANE